MKRALIVLPLIAILAGLVLFLSRNWATGAGPDRTNGGAAGSAEAPSGSATKNPGSTAPGTQPPAGENTGQIQFTVTSRGLPVKDAKIIVQKQGTDYFMTFATDAQGALLLRGLPPVDYGIHIEHPDYIAHDTESHVIAGKTTPIPVDLKQGGKIYGTVTDKSGRPLPKTKVFLLNGETNSAMTSTAVDTDENGSYAIKAVPPGNYGMRFRHAMHKPTDRSGFLLRSPTDEFKVDVSLELGARIVGRVVDDQGKPIEGAVVVGQNKGAAGLVKSDAEGKFILGGLNEIPANCSASKEGYGKMVLRNLPVNGPDVEFRLPRGATIAGRVVVDEPPRQVHVVLSRYDEDAKQVVMAESKFFPDPVQGAFAVPDIAPGTYWVDVQIGGYEAVERPQVTVAAGQTVEGLVVTFRKKS